MVLNFGMSPGFQNQDFQHLVFPNKMLVDYVRIYQRDGHENWGCDPSDHPTTQYIEECVSIAVSGLAFLPLTYTFQPYQCVHKSQPDNVGTRRLQIPSELTILRLLLNQLFMCLCSRPLHDFAIISPAMPLEFTRPSSSSVTINTVIIFTPSLLEQARHELRAA